MQRAIPREVRLVYLTSHARDDHLHGNCILYVSIGKAVNPGAASSTTQYIKPAAVSAPPQTSSPPPSQPTVTAQPPPPEQTAAVTPQQSGYGATDISNDEGPAFDGSGGFGLARGTKNTYVIEGMDEMSPEEYRQKLQESISARQAKRREEALKSGIIGNRSSNGYLDALGSQGEMNVVRDKMFKGKWRSDSVSAWMDALGEAERQKDGNVSEEATDKQMLDGVEDNASQEATSFREDKVTMPQQQNIRQSIQPKHESVIKFASSVKQSKTEKELSRKSEWQTDITDARKDDSPPNEASSEVLETRGLEEEKQWFNEKRQRPVPSSIRPEYETVKKFIGDASKQSKVSVSENRLERGWYNEKRVRPAPNSEPAERQTVSDRTGAQSTRITRSKTIDPKTSLKGTWYNEKRTRPVPNSEPADRPTVSNRTGVQSKRTAKSSGIHHASHRPDSQIWYDETRVRPIPNSEPPVRSTVSHRTGAEPEGNVNTASENYVSNAPISQTSADSPTQHIEKQASSAQNVGLAEQPNKLDATPKKNLENSFLRSLLNNAPPNRSKTAIKSSAEATLSTSSSEIMQWWKDTTNRPKDYAARPNASLNNTYEERSEHPKNYGDMKLELNE